MKATLHHQSLCPHIPLHNSRLLSNMSKSNANESQPVDQPTGLFLSIRLTETAIVSFFSALIGMGIGVTINFDSAPPPSSVAPAVTLPPITTNE